MRNLINEVLNYIDEVSEPLDNLNGNLELLIDELKTAGEYELAESLNDMYMRLSTSSCLDDMKTILKALRALK